MTTRAWLLAMFAGVVLAFSTLPLALQAAGCILFGLAFNGWAAALVDGDDAPARDLVLIANTPVAHPADAQNQALVDPDNRDAA
jgi:hypothetical protein